jgi:hypothetical protein
VVFAEASAMAINSLLANVHLRSYGRGTRPATEMGSETIDETATFGTSAIPSPIK